MQTTFLMFFFIANILYSCDSNKDLEIEKASKTIILNKAYKINIIDDSLFLIDAFYDHLGKEIIEDVYRLKDSTIVNSNITLNKLYKKPMILDNKKATFNFNNSIIQRIEVLNFREGFRGQDYGSKLIIYKNDGQIIKINYPNKENRLIYDLDIYKNNIVIISERESVSGQYLMRFFPIKHLN